MPSSHSVPQDLQFWDGVLDCVLLGSVKAHQRPVTFLVSRGSRLVSASQDYTLKVLARRIRLESKQFLLEYNPQIASFYRILGVNSHQIYVI